jgi:dTDP-4-amino-4,6-dideoxygalactose transaminase
MPFRVPFVDAAAHFRSMQAKYVDAMTAALVRGNVVMRDELKEFEANVARFIGTAHAVGVNSGTDAVHFALRAAGVGQGDDVITVSHGCIATISAIVHAGAKPVLVDVKEDCTMDMALARKAITPRTRAIVPVHLNGRLCDMAELDAIARDHGLLVIEDASHAMGATFRGRRAGAFGAAGCFSLYPFKMLGAFGDGGLVATNDPDLAQRVSVLRDYGQDRRTGDIVCFGYNSRLDNIQAAVLDVKLPYVPEWIERRRQIAQQYRSGLQSIAALTLPHWPGDDYVDVYMNYCVRTSLRDALVDYLKDRGIEPLTPLSLTTPVHRHKALRLDDVSLPVTERVAREFLYLPIYPELTDDQIEYVVTSVRNFFADR